MFSEETKIKGLKSNKFHYGTSSISYFFFNQREILKKKKYAEYKFKYLDGKLF